LTDRADVAQHINVVAGMQRARMRLTFFIPILGGIFTSGNGFPLRFLGMLTAALVGDSPSEPSPSTAFSNAWAACHVHHAFA
jgi:hypothetical protein